MKVYTVGQVNNYIKNIITQDYMLKAITIRGEVSNCKYHSLGHIYFSLKDETGSIPAVMFKGSVGKGLSFTLKDGQSVCCSGSIGVYERDGRYQLYATTIKQDGDGRLFEELERLKQKLNDEGLFDFDNKKEIPKYPKTVGVVTAKTGAAIQDIINVAKRRNPYVQLVLCPAKVQGEGAADTIVAGIKRLDAMGLDTIIVGRGGGSMEDLWTFNEEKVVRAIYEAKTPIITGIGHEVDMTLSDYASDRRAPTPSAACELAVPDIVSTLDALRKQSNRINTAINTKYTNAKYALDRFQALLEARNPATKLANNQQRLSELYDRLLNSMDKRLIGYKNKLEVYTAKIHAMSPTAKLTNGFGYIESEGASVTSVGSVKAGDSITITIHDGKILADVRGTSNE